MTNQEIISHIKGLVRSERQITNELLKFLALGERRRVFLDERYSSMHHWLTKGLGYSNTSAQRRLEAARLLKWVPKAFAKLEDGVVNLTNISRAQSIIASEERRSGVKLSRQEKADVVTRLEDKTTFEAERELLAIFPEAAPAMKPDSRKVVTSEVVRLSMNCPNQAMTDLQRVREILSNQMPHATDGDLVAHVLSLFIKSHDAESSAPVEPCVKMSRSKRRQYLVQKAGGQCEWRHEKTGERCPSRFRLEEDHLIPRALGGGNEISNFRLLCRAHNQRAAECILGEAKMEPYRLDADLSVPSGNAKLKNS